MESRPVGELSEWELIQWEIGGGGGGLRLIHLILYMRVIASLRVKGKCSPFNSLDDISNFFSLFFLFFLLNRVCQKRTRIGLGRWRPNQR